MRLALVGCGNIADFHIPAMQEAGFDCVSVAGSVNSLRAKEFAKRHTISKVYADPVELLRDSSGWDALLLASPVSTMLDYIKLAAPMGKPILAEKPVALNHEELTPTLKYQNVLVAYNRRFYSTTEYAKTFVDSHADIIIKVSIPEQRIDPDHNVDFPHRLPPFSYQNSVHLFDLVNFLAGKVQWEAASAISGSDRYLGIVAFGKSDKGFTVQLDNCFNSPDNFAVNIISGNERVELRPIEIAQYYKGMQVNEPTKKIPFSTYTPKLIDQIVVTDEEAGFKPGLLMQAKEFMHYCKTAGDYRGATLVDAYNALKTAHSLLDHCN
jgi:predicted dehydrogenase